jgi:hypothetical protein
MIRRRRLTRPSLEATAWQAQTPYKKGRRLAQAPLQRAFRNPKSGIRNSCLSYALRHDFLQVFHIFGRGTMMLHFGAVARNVSRGEGLALKHAV